MQTKSKKNGERKREKKIKPQKKDTKKRTTPTFLQIESRKSEDSVSSTGEEMKGNPGSILNALSENVRSGW
ncbi:hypothetical protein TNCV_164441 [Trichonephila clavipes]|nr:hypothetical protein TNCV_164441 [Trichonephila clavipes]